MKVKRKDRKGRKSRRGWIAVGGIIYEHCCHGFFWFKVKVVEVDHMILTHSLAITVKILSLCLFFFFSLGCLLYFILASILILSSSSSSSFLGFFLFYFNITLFFFFDKWFMYIICPTHQWHDQSLPHWLIHHDYRREIISSEDKLPWFVADFTCKIWCL